MSENKNVIETHGCIVCAKVFSLLVVYTPDSQFLDCTVTSPGGHIISNQQLPLVACDTHTADEIEAAYQRWHLNRGQGTEYEQDEE